MDTVPNVPNVPTVSAVTATETWLATIAATFIVKYAGDTSLYVPVIKLVEIFLGSGYLNMIVPILSINIVNIVYLGLIIGVIWYIYNFGSNKKLLLNMDTFYKYFYTKLSLSTDDGTMMFLWYFDAHKEYITTNYDEMDSRPEIEFANMLEGGVCSNISKKTCTKPEYGKKIQYKDTTRNVSGFFVWHINDFSTKKTDIKNKDLPTIFDKPYYIESVTLYISKFCNYNAKKYFDEIKNEYQQHIKNTYMKKLSYVYINVLPPDHRENIYLRNHNVEYFDLVENTNSKNIFDSYFHNDKKHLIKLIDSMNSQNKARSDKFQKISHLGMILHGPPGTGKSELVRRMGIYLKRHIVVLDLLKIPKNKLIPTLQNPWCNVKELTTDKFIFYLDEFDAMIVELKRREVLINKMQENKNHSFNNDSISTLAQTFRSGDNRQVDHVIDQYSHYITYSDLLGILQGLIPLHGAIFVATTNNLDAIKTMCSKSKSKQTIVEKAVVLPIEQTITPPIEQTITPPIEQTITPPIEQTITITPPIEQTITPPIEQTITPPIKQTITPPIVVDVQTIESPVVVDEKDMYKKENNSCALIRHGRLSPFLCDYFNGQTIKEICMYFFGKSLNISDDLCPNIINTQIMHWADIYYDEPDGYEQFVEQIFKHMD